MTQRAQLRQGRPRLIGRHTESLIDDLPHWGPDDLVYPGADGYSLQTAQGLKEIGHAEPSPLLETPSRQDGEKRDRNVRLHVGPSAQRRKPRARIRLGDLKGMLDLAQLVVAVEHLLVGKGDLGGVNQLVPVQRRVRPGGRRRVGVPRRVTAENGTRVGPAVPHT